MASCNANQYWDQDELTCKCDLGKIIKVTCGDVWQVVDMSDEVCACVSVECLSGQYPYDVDECQDCPEPDFIATNGMCSPASDKEYATYKEGGLINTYEQYYTGCYLPSECAATDKTGTFELIADCLYSEGGGGPSIAPGLE